MMERLDSFMARANAAYYAQRDPFADFVTAPEISQVFGELLGLWAAVMWQAMGSPAPVALIEAGPGRGTLMADATRAIRRMAPGFAAALRLHLIETSPRLRRLQGAALGEDAAEWHDTLAGVPEGPLLLFANEFLDALPIRQFVRRGEGWCERFVHDSRFVEMPAASWPDWPSLSAAPDDGLVVETAEPARCFVRRLAIRVVAHGGGALLIDYGPEFSAPGDSLQALRNRAPADPLRDPGAADLTAHVDFAALAQAAREVGARVFGPLPQGLFLAELGLFQRTGQLARTQPPEKAGALIAAAQRLAEPDRMGRLFKVMAICHPQLPIPPGFAA